MHNRGLPAVLWSSNSRIQTNEQVGWRARDGPWAIVSASRRVAQSAVPTGCIRVAAPRPAVPAGLEIDRERGVYVDAQAVLLRRDAGAEHVQLHAQLRWQQLGHLCKEARHAELHLRPNVVHHEGRRIGYPGHHRICLPAHRDRVLRKAVEMM